MRKEIRQIFAAIHVLVAVKELKTRSAPFVNKVIKRNDFDWKLQLCKQQRKKYRMNVRYARYGHCLSACMRTGRILNNIFSSAEA